ncbi:pepsin-like aspartic protease [Aliiglaciecola sp. M165]|uniref:pepsin-like aspartic protease n=1 Tax=Aliiglaciecola sp. M165 TaxID=2593649 RepID=UPI00117D1208|nr:pepsin-like aspartic protease [Aliiglaciecola sp. M165]TRY32398.1 A1 family peptidase [Aliiglaciecola sp. M165]
MTKSLLLPLNNALAKGDLTVQVFIENIETPINLIVDTGSSSLVVIAESVEKGTFHPTQMIQHMAYGEGSWTGPVVKADIQLGKSVGQHTSIIVEQVNIALANNVKKDTFMAADGIMGLAFAELNIGQVAEKLLQKYNVNPLVTYPWPEQFQQKPEAPLKQELFDLPKQEISPIFSELLSHKVVANEFAFVVHRSSIFNSKSLSCDQQHTHPLNTGILVLGNPKQHDNIHNNDFLSVAVVHDKYYNVHIKSVGLKGFSKIPFPALQQSYKNAYVSNGIVDSGASAIIFPKQVFAALTNQFEQVNSSFSEILEHFATFTGVEVGIPMDSIVLSEWPDIELELQGADGESVLLSMSPFTYWQTHAPEADLISFKITTLEGWPNQGILGLPLMNNYFTIFNRSKCPNGVIEFANRRYSPHKFNDDLHQDHDALAAHFKQHGHDL